MNPRIIRIFSGVLSLSVIGISLYAFLNYRDVLDYIALRNYNPSAEIVRIADVTTMQSDTRKVFYVNHPQLQDKESFRSSCIKQEETIVLGCYVSNDGIYIFNVDDPRLAGVVEVTAAHEVLHAMYDRLSSDKRAEVDAMTAEVFAKLQDERIKTNIANYQKRDASVVPNELHSILATEVRELPSKLELYYSQYFADRLAIVALSEKYEQTFTQLENQVAEYQSQLNDLKARLDASQETISSLAGTIGSERARLDSLLRQERIDEYNSSVPGFNSLVNQYNRTIQDRRNLVDQYNGIVEKLNELVTTESQLLQSLSTEDIQTQEGVRSE